MNSEPLTTTDAPEDAAVADERGLLVAVLLMVVLGATAMLLMV
jgi:hypothetical protein